MLKILWKFIALLGHGYLFFAYALKYNLSLVVVSKLGNIDGAYDSKAKLLLSNFETTWQDALFEGHNKKKIPMPFPKSLSRYNNL